MSKTFDLIKIRQRFTRLPSEMVCPLSSLAGVRGGGGCQRSKQATTPTLIMDDFLQELESVGVRQRISDKDLDNISIYSCSRWRNLPAFLGLNSILVEDINKRTLTEQEKRREFFQVWKATKGSTATYKALIHALLSIGCREDAVCVGRLLLASKSSNDRPQGSAVDASVAPEPGYVFQAGSTSIPGR